MLILNKVQYLGRLGLADEFKRTHLQRCGQFGNDILRLLITESLFQQFLRIADTALSDILLCQTHLVEFLYNGVLDFGGNTPGVGNLQRQLLNLILFQMLENIR